MYLKPEPKQKIAAVDVSLEKLIPEQLGEWRVVPQVGVPMQDDALNRKVEATYQQTLARFYENNEKHQLMISIAYGSNQINDGMQVHRPEYCYKAQGYEVEVRQDARVDTGYGGLQVRQLIAHKTARLEPITYWITIGDHAVLPGFQRKLTQLRYGLRGEVPDGMLIRVSSINPDASAAYTEHAEFIKALMASVDAKELLRLTGLRPLMAGS